MKTPLFGKFIAMVKREWFLLILVSVIATIIILYEIF